VLANDPEAFGVFTVHASWPLGQSQFVSGKDTKRSCLLGHNREHENWFAATSSLKKKRKGCYEFGKVNSHLLPMKQNRVNFIVNHTLGLWIGRL
jgi:hypothetical protein